MARGNTFSDQKMEDSYNEWSDHLGLSSDFIQTHFGQYLRNFFSNFYNPEKDYSELNVDSSNSASGSSVNTDLSSVLDEAESELKDQYSSDLSQMLDDYNQTVKDQESSADKMYDRMTNLVDYQNQASLDLTRNQYSAMVDGMRKAGLNPNLLYSNMGSLASSASASSISPAQSASLNRVNSTSRINSSYEFAKYFVELSKNSASNDTSSNNALIGLLGTIFTIFAQYV